MFPQENQCEGHCVLGKKGPPVQISAIERYISDYYLNIYRPAPSRSDKGKIAIIGSGPAGISIAFILSQRDYDVTIFEGHDLIGVIVSSTAGIDVMENGLVAVDGFGRTSREGIFASGDVVTGAKAVVEAVNVSRRVADAMDEYVRSKS